MAKNVSRETLIEIKCAYDKLVPLKDLNPHPKNPNKHSKDQIERLAKVIKYQGVRRPIRVSRLSNCITSGHGLLAALGSLGRKDAPVNYQDYENEDQEFADLVADNSLQSWSELDLASINLEVPSLGPDFDIDWLGIKDFEIDAADKYGDKDADDVPEVKQTDIKRGDLFQLGNHKILCGDSTVKEDVERLMNGDKADMCFTSPPYNLGENAKLRGYNGDGDDSAYLTKSDHKSSEEYLDFLNKFTQNAINVSDSVFINIQLLAGNKFALPKFWNEWHSHLIDLMIWDKEHAAPQMAARVLNSAFELIFIFSSEKWPTRSMKHGIDFRGDIQNIYRLNPLRGPKDESKKDHGAVFPVAFAEYFIKHFSDKLIYEPFCGSGSTLIACEKTNRRCFGMEIDPQYCQVIIDRFEKFSGIKATKL